MKTRIMRGHGLHWFERAWIIEAASDGVMTGKQIAAKFWLPNCTVYRILARSDSLIAVRARIRRDQLAAPIINGRIASGSPAPEELRR